MQPVTINGGYVMRAWYDIKNGDLMREEDTTGVRESARKMSDLIKEEMDKYALPANKIVLAGFSQGGVIALHTALRYPEQLAGVMVLSAYIAMPETVEKERSEANRPISIFMAHGDHDPIIAIRHAQASRDMLTSLGYQISWHSYNMEHSVVPDEIDDIAEWLKKQLIE
jgi:phospholipase/carboxylesterase